MGPVDSRSSEWANGEAAVLWSCLIIQTRAIYRLYIQLGGESVTLNPALSVITGGQAVYEGNDQGHAACATPNPGTFMKPVLLPHLSEGALTCVLGDF